MYGRCRALDLVQTSCIYTHVTSGRSPGWKAVALLCTGSMTFAIEKNDGTSPCEGVFVTFGSAGACFVCLTGSRSETLRIPGHLARRCGVLVEIRDQYEESQHDIPVPLSMPHARSWLFCATLKNPADLLRQDGEVLVGALKVRYLPVPMQFTHLDVLSLSC